MEAFLQIIKQRTFIPSLSEWKNRKLDIKILLFGGRKLEIWNRNQKPTKRNKALCAISQKVQCNWKVCCLDFRWWWKGNGVLLLPLVVFLNRRCFTSYTYFMPTRQPTTHPLTCWMEELRCTNILPTNYITYLPLDLIWWRLFENEGAGLQHAVHHWAWFSFRGVKLSWWC